MGRRVDKGSYDERAGQRQDYHDRKQHCPRRDVPWRATQDCSLSPNRNSSLRDQMLRGPLPRCCQSLFCCVISAISEPLPGSSCGTPLYRWRRPYFGCCWSGVVAAGRLPLRHLDLWPRRAGTGWGLAGTRGPTRGHTMFTAPLGKLLIPTRPPAGQSSNSGSFEPHCTPSSPDHTYAYVPPRHGSMTRPSSHCMCGCEGTVRKKAARGSPSTLPRGRGGQYELSRCRLGTVSCR